MHVRNDTPTSSSQFTIHTSLLFDSKAKTFVENVSIGINKKSGLVTSVQTREASSPLFVGPEDLDLRGLTVLPGLSDSHTHIFLHAYKEVSSINQERDESLPERILRAGNHLRAALKAGYTTYRDLGTEGVGSLDTGVRDAVNRGIIPGPRLFVATEALASSGGYEVRIEGGSQGTIAPRISDPCDGIYGVTAGVRRRLAAGADVIKFYADYRKRALRFPVGSWPGSLPIMHPPEDLEERNPNFPQFNQSEMNAIVTEAKRSRCPVAAHAQEDEWKTKFVYPKTAQYYSNLLINVRRTVAYDFSPATVIEAANAGVTTLEHGFFRSEEAIEALKRNGTIFVPTISIIATEYAGVGDYVSNCLKQTNAAWKAGVKLACGGDTGGFPHGENALELELFERAGVPLEETLTAATLHGWEACGGDWCGRKFGWLGEGWAADLVAVEGDPREDGISVVRKVRHVIKDGRVMVQDGRLVD